MIEKPSPNQVLRHTKYGGQSTVVEVEAGRVLLTNEGQKSPQWYTLDFVRNNYEAVAAPGLPLEGL